MELDQNRFPIDSQLENIQAALNESSSLLIKAETGAGKTTRLPPYLTHMNPGKVLVLEPRRLAAKLSAQRCAETLNSKLGDLVGHHIRFDKQVSQATELLFITEGLFLPYLREDPALSQYSIIIIDEFHERNIHTDVALALIKNLQATIRPDLKLIVMSATLDTATLETYLNDAAVFNISGRTFPIEIEYKDLEPESAVLEMVKDPRCQKNILVFLPGMGAIRQLESQLKKSLPVEIQVVPLHSSLSKKEQNKAFEGSQRKVILSTNIAETSLTVPDITGVIDLGTERRASFAPWSGMPLLQLVKISQASATQRAGRAGRIENGLVFRLYDQNDFSLREKFTPPEIKRVELSHYILDLYELGLNPESLNWFEPPEEKNLSKAMELLSFLKAITQDKITPLGKFIAKLPLHPRVGAMLFNGKDSPHFPDILLAACIVNEGMVLSKSAEFSIDDDETCDLSIQCDLIKAFKFRDKDLSDYHQSFLDKKSAQRVVELFESLAPRFSVKTISPSKTLPKDLVSSLLAGFPDRVAAKRTGGKKGKQSQSYNFCLGRGGKIAWKSALSSTQPEYIIVLDALENPKANAAIGTTIQAASSIPKSILTDRETEFYSQEKETNFNEKKGTITISTHEKYGKLTINSKVGSPLIPKGEVLVQMVKDNWPWPFEDILELEIYNKKVQCLQKNLIENNCPEFLGEMLDLLIETSIDDETSFEQLKESGIKYLIDSQQAPQDQYVLDKEAPNRIELENGKSFNINYHEEERPFIKARVQDLYSVNKHPSICEGKLGLTIKLMSPAERVAQVVSDLPGFWKSSWEQVRNDLKARYPKHNWPEDPAHSEPIRIKRK